MKHNNLFSIFFCMVFIVAIASGIDLRMRITFATNGVPGTGGFCCTHTIAQARAIYHLKNLVFIKPCSPIVAGTIPKLIGVDGYITPVSATDTRLKITFAINGIAGTDAVCYANTIDAARAAFPSKNFAYITSYTPITPGTTPTLTGVDGYISTIDPLPPVQPTAPATGDGSSNNPYLIASLENLCWIASNTANWIKYYKQVENINASSTSDWNCGEGWIPIGNEANQFMGSYNGNGYSIDGLYIHRPSSNYQGLFGCTSHATIEGIRLTHVNIYGQNFVGSLVASSANTISNCYSSGSVYGTGGSVGGVIGCLMSSVLYPASMVNCHFNGNISGRYYIGGLVGNTYRSNVLHSFAEGSIIGMSNVGGLVGFLDKSRLGNSYYLGNINGTGGSIGGLVGDIYEFSDASGNYSNACVNGSGGVGGLAGNIDMFSGVSQCYSTGCVTGTEIYIGGLAGCIHLGSYLRDSYATGCVTGGDFIGGLLGYNREDCTVDRCYSIGDVNSIGGNKGGLVGKNDASVNNCFWDIQTSGLETSFGGTGKTTNEMKTNTTFSNAGWDINGTVWRIDNSGSINYGYPFLAWQSSSGTSLYMMRMLNFSQMISNMIIFPEVDWDLINNFIR